MPKDILRNWGMVFAVIISGIVSAAVIGTIIHFFVVEIRG